MLVSVGKSSKVLVYLDVEYSSRYADGMCLHSTSFLGVEACLMAVIRKSVATGGVSLAFPARAAKTPLPDEEIKSNAPKVS